MCSNAIRNCVPLVLALAVTLHSCSIKEDRGECPCWLTLQVPSQGGSHLIVNWVLEASDTVREGILDDENNPSCTVEVPREKIRLVAVSGADGRFAGVQGLKIEEGRPYPPVYYYQTVLDTSCDSLRDTIRLHKNHAYVKIRDNSPNASFTYYLCGNSCGFDLDGKVARGPFRSKADFKEGAYSCIVPRQGDNSLRLDIYLGQELMRSFPIGDIIAQSGFDWEAEDLEDIDLTLDYSATQVTFTVNGWTHRLTFYYEF